MTWIEPQTFWSRVQPPSDWATCSCHLSLCDWDQCIKFGVTDCVRFTSNCEVVHQWSNVLCVRNQIIQAAIMYCFCWNCTSDYRMALHIIGEHKLQLKQNYSSYQTFNNLTKSSYSQIFQEELKNIFWDRWSFNTDKEKCTFGDLKVQSLKSGGLYLQALLRTVYYVMWITPPVNAKLHSQIKLPIFADVRALAVILAIYFLHATLDDSLPLPTPHCCVRPCLRYPRYEQTTFRSVSGVIKSVVAINPTISCFFCGGRQAKGWISKKGQIRVYCYSNLRANVQYRTEAMQ